MVPVCCCCHSTALLPPRYVRISRPLVLPVHILSTKRPVNPPCAISEHTAEALAFAAAAALGGPPLARAVYGQLQPKRCKTCLGTGYILCTTCLGRGRVGLSLPGEAANVSSCSKCGRRGHLKCDQCNATGITNYWLWQPASDPGWGPRGS
ncbi:hypothetical protein COO60DRAFT_477018 [Scenedesmus sp. NREL 46B-D3]|nr:hypothetical protein COO60DRAFT_477018 [Scenedesmus sp. NREL 46B-D3]